MARAHHKDRVEVDEKLSKAAEALRHAANLQKNILYLRQLVVDSSPRDLSGRSGAKSEPKGVAQMLHDYHWHRQPATPDGNCAFHAVRDALLNHFGDAYSNDARKMGLDVHALRQRIASQIKAEGLEPEAMKRTGIVWPPVPDAVKLDAAVLHDFVSINRTGHDWRMRVLRDGDWAHHLDLRILVDALSNFRTLHRGGSRQYFAGLIIHTERSLNAFLSSASTHPFPGAGSAVMRTGNKGFVINLFYTGDHFDGRKDYSIQLSLVLNFALYSNLAA